ncbi:MAG: hypothetical protein IT423_12210 [Pirellulaceae bacterium]|nr:hypothetical protein [Pirellulaceae bacterium]
MVRNLWKAAALGLLGLVTIVAVSDDASARNRGRGGYSGYRGGYSSSYRAPATRYYGAPRVYSNSQYYAPRSYSSGRVYVTPSYGLRSYGTGYGNSY